ncbi:ISAon1 family transposase N-terminal region protein [Marinifilum sp.]|uniref:ISAon1 family transposase N-terminal region protein n=1 Tax=Marinifilum sp. TaxID=2033137 RepID=UPI003BABF827
MTDQENYEQLVRLFLPEGVLDYFIIANIILDGEAVNVHLEERNLPPSEYSQDKLESKGFSPAVTVQDFPLLDKALLLHLKRRRWLNHSTGKIVSRDWQLVASGTRLQCH